MPRSRVFLQLLQTYVLVEPTCSIPVQLAIVSQFSHKLYTSKPTNYNLDRVSEAVEALGRGWNIGVLASFLSPHKVEAIKKFQFLLQIKAIFWYGIGPAMVLC